MSMKYHCHVLVAMLLRTQVSATGAPVFPAGVQDILRSITQQQSGMDGATGNEAGAVEHLVQHSAAQLEESLVDSMTDQALRQVAYAKVHERLLKYVYVGGCQRTYRGCPLDWSLDSSGRCQPPTEYGGLCGPLNLKHSDALEISEKESLAWRCRLSWPCEHACQKDLTSCPLGWENVEGLCLAPSSYSGICSPATDFSRFAKGQRGDWSILCDAEFPCK